MAVLKVHPRGFSSGEQQPKRATNAEPGEGEERVSVHRAAWTKRGHVSSSGGGGVDDVVMISAQQFSSRPLASLGVDTTNDAAAMGVGSKQVSVRVFVWHHTIT